MSSKIVESKNPVIQPLSSILFGPGVGAKYLASMVYCGCTCNKTNSRIIIQQQFSLKLVQCQPRLNQEIQPFVVEGIHFAAHT